MAEGWLAVSANAALDTLFSTYPWVKLHVGAPGAAGTANAATETTRKQVTMSAASAGSKTTTADLAWTNVAGSEDYTHLTMHTASSAGTPGASGTITANPVVAGDNFTIPTGSFTGSLSLAS